MNLRELLASVAPERFADAELEGEAGRSLAEALHDQEGHEAPLLVQVFSAIGTWIGAGMLAMIFFAFEIHELVSVALPLALVMLTGAVLLSRRPRRSLAMTQLIWALALGGDALVAGALGEIDVPEEVLVTVLFGLAAASTFLVRVPSFALAASVCAVGFATWLAALLELPLYPLWVAIPVAALATAAWIFEDRGAARFGRSWAALAYGLPLGVAGPVTLVGLEGEGEGLVAQGPGTTVATVALVGLIGVVLYVAQREARRGGERLELRTHVLGATAVVAVLAARHVPGVSLALLWLLVAHLRKSPALQALASIQLAGFLFFFYYQLDTTLLLKSLWVLSTGVVLVLGAWIGRPRPDRAGAAGEGEAEQAEQAEEPSEGRGRALPRWLSAAALVVLSVGLVAIPALKKQRVLRAGHSVLLPLAPVDPRSLMQGDYMRLSYALEDEMREAVGLREFDDLEGLPRHGVLVLGLDGEGVGHFARIHEGEALGPDELLLEYRVRDGGQLRVGGESFLFEEGTGEPYERARYGELVVAEDGEAILIGLRGEARESLGVRLHE